MFIVNEGVSVIAFLMISSSDHISPALGLSPTVLLSKNGAAFAAAQGVISEIGNGWYKVEPNVLDTDTVGALILHATAATADPTDVLFSVDSGLVNLGPTQTTNIIGNIQGSVSKVTNPVKCILCCGCKC